jgi:transposase
MSLNHSADLTAFALLPELRLLKFVPLKRWGVRLIVEKVSEFEVCPKCAHKTRSVHDRRRVDVQDEPMRGKAIFLEIVKRRFRCLSCRAVFTEPVPGIPKRGKFTARFERALCWAADRFSSLKDVEKAFRCSTGKCFKAAFDELDRRLKSRRYPLPTAIGIDEHSLRKPKYQATEFSTILVDHENHRVYDLVDGRSKADVVRALGKYEGKERVKFVTMDLSQTYRSAVREALPGATIVADRFHVQRLLNRALNKERMRATGDKRDHPALKLVLRNVETLKTREHVELRDWLSAYPKAKELWEHKETLRRMYRAKAPSVAAAIFERLVERMHASTLRAARSLAKTLSEWKSEILAYHMGRLSNGRTEGFNRMAKLIQREGFGYRSFRNYRRRVLNRCL